MVWGMASVNTQLMMQLTKGSGFRAKNKAKAKSLSRVGVFSKVTSKMTWSTDTEKCITTLLEITSRDNGVKMWSVGWALWTGLISDKSTWESGRIISKKAGVCTFGFNPKAKESTWGTDMREAGRTEFETDMESFTMQTALSTKATGKITWKKATHSILTKMAKYHLYSLKKTEW